MTNEELKAIRARAEAGRSNAANEWDRCIHGEMVHECPACRGDDAKVLLAEIERLRGLIKDLPEVARELCERPGNEDAFLVDIGDRVAEGLREHIDESGDVR